MNEETYGSLYKEHFMRQYEVFLAGIEKISDRRERANKYFWTVNSGTIIAAGFIYNTSTLISKHFLLLLVMLFGLLLSIVFWLLINSYKQLNTGKFIVLHQMEEKLPVQMYSDEWVALGEGKDKSKYYPFSHIEMLIPMFFAFCYAIGLLILISPWLYPVAKLVM